MQVYLQQVRLLYFIWHGRYCNIFSKYPPPAYSYYRPENGIWDFRPCRSLISTKPTYYVYTRWNYSYPGVGNWHYSLLIWNGKLEQDIHPLTKRYHTYEKDNVTTKSPSYHIPIVDRIPHVTRYWNTVWCCVYDFFSRTMFFKPYLRTYNSC